LVLVAVHIVERRTLTRIAVVAGIRRMTFVSATLFRTLRRRTLALPYGADAGVLLLDAAVLRQANLLIYLTPTASCLRPSWRTTTACDLQVAHDYLFVAVVKLLPYACRYGRSAVLLRSTIPVDAIEPHGDV
jgi:hypothetical protein